MLDGECGVLTPYWRRRRDDWTVSARSWKRWLALAVFNFAVAVALLLFMSGAFSVVLTISSGRYRSDRIGPSCRAAAGEQKGAA